MFQREVLKSVCCVLRPCLFVHLPGVEVQRPITSSMNIDVEKDLCEEPVSEEDGGDEVEDENANGTMNIENLGGVVGYISGNGEGDWKRL